jgi:hypothetical protein
MSCDLATDFDGFLPLAERSVKKGEFDREKKDKEKFSTELLISSAVSKCCKLSCFEIFFFIKSKRTNGGQQGVTK